MQAGYSTAPGTTNYNATWVSPDPLLLAKGETVDRSTWYWKDFENTGGWSWIKVYIPGTDSSTPIEWKVNITPIY